MKGWQNFTGINDKALPVVFFHLRNCIIVKGVVKRNLTSDS